MSLEADTDGVVDCHPEVLEKELRLYRELPIKTEDYRLDWHEVFQYVVDICLLLLLVAITRFDTEPSQETLKASLHIASIEHSRAIR